MSLGGEASCITTLQCFGAPRQEMEAMKKEADTAPEIDERHLYTRHASCTHSVEASHRILPQNLAFPSRSTFGNHGKSMDECGPSMLLVHQRGPSSLEKKIVLSTMVLISDWGFTVYM